MPQVAEELRDGGAAARTLAGRVALVTGANRGIGCALSVGLLRRGAHVVMACRDAASGRAALQSALAAAGRGSAELLVVDLADQRTIRRALAEFLGRHSRLHLLVNNAGVMTKERRSSAEGIELTLAVNYVAPFVFTSALSAALSAAAPSSVVNVASALHYRGDCDFDDLELERGFSGARAYARSKLMLVLSTVEFAERLAPRGIAVNCVDPGGVATSLMRELPWYVRQTSRLVFMRASPDAGAAPLLRLAVEATPEVTGRYFERMLERRPHALAHSREARRRLWAETERRLMRDGLEQV